MKTHQYSLSRSVLIHLFSLILTLNVQSQGVLAPVELTINLHESGKAISSNLVGVFFEDLNYAADGGLYAELIQNRSFEYSPTERTEWGALSFWEVQKSEGGDGHLRVGEVRPVHRDNTHYVILTVTETGNDGIGITNPGFDGIPVKAGETYRASFWSYQPFMNRQWGPENSIEGRPMPVTLQLIGEDGAVLAEQKLEVAGRAWKQYEVELTPPTDDPKATFVLKAHAKGGLALDMISLFPKDTFKGHRNGLRKDLAQTIADIHPKFMRFPGGCLVHGQGIHHYYYWKKSVGPVEQRQSQRNLWGYHQTLGLGYFEYFQYCEDIGALALPVVSAGVCCQHSGDTPGRGQEGLPIDEMPSYIQDVLDLIEWANGSVDSEWGAVRAEAGHLEPFGLTYLGVGNEDAITEDFEVRFKMIHDVLKAKHPEITVVGTVGPFAEGEDWEKGWKFARKLDLEMVDEHYYVSPQWFWDNLNRYDSFSRDEAAVYVGEYAAHEPDRRNTLRSALAEAAGLISFEKNGDIVEFASYAPMLSRRGHTQWTPDLIYFTATDVYRTPNYYVQQLFGQNSGDLLVKAVMVGENIPDKLVCSVVKDSESGAYVLKMVNGNTEAVPLVVTIDGMKDVNNSQTTCIILTGPELDSVNEDGQTETVHPVSLDITVTSNFEYELPAHSLTVIRWSEDS